MTPEQLKVIAEGMGYEDLTIDAKTNYVIFKEEDISLPFERVYNPLTNNDQMVEIMEKLEIDIRWIDGDCFATSEDAIGKSKIINEAVCNAAYRYFKR